MRGAVGAITHGVITGEGAEYTASLCVRHVCRQLARQLSRQLSRQLASIMASIVHTHHTHERERAHTRTHTQTKLHPKLASVQSRQSGSWRAGRVLTAQG